MRDPNTLIDIIVETIQKRTGNWVGPFLAKSIAEEIVGQVTEDADMDKLAAAQIAASAARVFEPTNCLIEHVEYAVKVAETLNRERDEYIIALDEIVQAQFNGKLFEPYEIARRVLENNKRSCR